MPRSANRLVLLPFIAVMLESAATAIYLAARPFFPFDRNSTTILAEEPLASKSAGEEPSANSDEETRIRRRMYELDEKSRSGEQLTEAETAERWHLFSNHLTEEDKRAIARLDNVKEMPRTEYPDYYPIPADDKRLSEVWSVHGMAESQFIGSSGFGFFRMRVFQNERGGRTAHEAIDRVELVSLLTSSEPSAYVIDDMATMRIAKVAKRRSLDAFESAALDAIQRGENLVYSPIEPTRMFGAIRAGATCLRCHDDKCEGDLLGAFTYWLKLPVNQIKASR